MNEFYHAITGYYVIGLDFTLALVMLGLLRIGGASNRLVSITALGTLLYLIGLVWAISGQRLFPLDISGLWLYIIILGYVLLVGGVFYFTPIKTVLLNLSQEQILMTQGLRVFVAAGFFTEGILGVIPGGFGILDGFMHMSSAFLALMAAIAWITSASYKNQLVWLANIVGLTDIITITTGICFFVFQDMGPHHNMMYAVFFAAPVFIWLHFISILKVVRSVPVAIHQATAEI